VPTAVATLTPAVVAPITVSKGQKLAIGVGLVIVLGLVGRWAFKANLQHDEEMAKSDATKIAVAAALDQTVRASDLKSGEILTSGEEKPNPSKQEKYDFAKMTREQAPKRTGLNDEEALIQQKAAESLQVLFTWMNNSISQYTKDRPLLVREFPGSLSSQAQVFSGADRQIFFSQGGAIRQRKWSDLKPVVLGEVIVSALRDSTVPPPNEVIQGAEAYAYLNGLPQMNESMQEGRWIGSRE
jgi:hypothetical protein